MEKAGGAGEHMVSGRSRVSGLGICRVSEGDWVSRRTITEQYTLTKHINDHFRFRQYILFSL